ncbi:MAG: lipase family protein [Polyangiaceae bacterium]|jgi:pimeloyl-ACP methyl ester carboxylesterase
MVGGRWMLLSLGAAALVTMAACGASKGATDAPLPAPSAADASASSSSSSGGGSTSSSGAAEESSEGNGDAGDGDGEASPDGGDAGAPRADVPAIACLDTVGAVYATPTGMPAMTMGLRGAILTCAQDVSYSVSDVTAKLTAKSVTGVVPTSGFNFYRIAYRTYRDDGVPGVSTAGVYLPTTPRSLPLPVVAVAHPTEGLAPSCTPSENATSLDDLAVPWVSQGFAVIATDYAGLGNAGVQGYTDNHDQAHSLLDSVRALRALLDPGVLDQRVLLVGYSQGGGAVLAAQGLAGSYGADGNVVAVVVFAAEYFMRNDSFGYQQLLENPTEASILTGVTRPVVAATRDYAFGYNVLGPSSAAVTFPASLQSGVASSLMSLCEVPFGGYIQGAAPTVGDIFDEDFRTSLLACLGAPAAETDGGTDGGVATCSGVASQFYTWMQSDLVPPDPAGAPILYVQGLADTVMPPDQEAACNIDQLDAAGVSVQVCVDTPAEHTTVVPRNVAFAVQWSEAKLYGGTLPACSSSGMPACSP